MNPEEKDKKSGGSIDPAGYEAILSSIREGICRIGPDRTVIYANESASRILGRPLSEIIGIPYPKLFFEAEGPEDPSCEPIEFAITEGEFAQVNSEKMVRPDGSEFLAELKCVPFNERGASGALVTLIDVTNRQDVEEAVSAARDEALIAAHSKAEFLAHMSHEIRTPLTGIIGTADLLSQTDTSEDQAEYIRMLRSSTEFLFSIVNDILDFSKLEAGKFVPKNKSFGIRELAERALDPYRSVASAKQINLSLEIRPNVPATATGDPGCVRQILNNLVSNAVKFTDHGSVTVKASPGKNKSAIRFGVIDTGIGIEQGKSELLFAPFGQSERRESGFSEGTGLGLAIARRLVILLKGEIGFESNKGSGTEFWFEVPLLPASDTPAQVAPNRPALELDGKTPRILVVEDNPINMTVMQKMLGNIGLESESADDGESAVEKCRSESFDIVFMDCQMPGIDGYEASRRILELKNGSPSIIAFTANVAEDEFDNYRSAGMSGMLRKPFTEHDLIRVINSLRVAADGTKYLDLNGDFIEHSVSQFVEVETLNRLVSLETDDPRGFLVEILEVFVRHASLKLDELRRFFSKRNRKAIRHVAHNLRGSSANVGIKRLSSLFGELEDEASAGGWAGLESLLDEITEEFDSVKTSISRLKLKENPNDGKRGISS